jgi:hypothetical protein
LEGRRRRGRRRGGIKGRGIIRRRRFYKFAFQ